MEWFYTTQGLLEAWRDPVATEPAKVYFSWARRFKDLALAVLSDELAKEIRVLIKI